jgi:hypothetical protein
LIHSDEADEEEEDQQNYYDLLDCRPDAPNQEITHKYEALLEKHGPNGEEPDEELVISPLNKGLGSQRSIRSALRPAEAEDV